MTDKPWIPLYDNAIVFSLPLALNMVYVRERSTCSPLLQEYRNTGFSSSIWTEICLDPDVTLAAQQTACHLRWIWDEPRIHYDIPDCRYCGDVSGNMIAHVEMCPVVYGKLCWALHGLLKIIIKAAQGTVLCQGDHWALTYTTKGTIAIIVGSEKFAATAMNRAKDSARADQVLFVSWSGLVAQRVTDPHTDLYATKDLRVRLAKSLLRDMCTEKGHNLQSISKVHIFPTSVIGPPFIQDDQLLPYTALSMTGQIMIAAIFRRMTRPKLMSGFRYHVYGLCQPRGMAFDHDLRFVICEPGWCEASDAPTQIYPVQIACMCVGKYVHARWALYKEYPPGLSLYINDAYIAPMTEPAWGVGHDPEEEGGVWP
jgi:hypothetical protein